MTVGVPLLTFILALIVSEIQSFIGLATILTCAVISIVLCFGVLLILSKVISEEVITNENKNNEEIIASYHRYIYPRPGTPPHVMKHIPNATVADAPLMDISSTFIRRAITESKDVPFFLHDKVYQYIKKKRLYEK